LLDSCSISRVVQLPFLARCRQEQISPDKDFYPLTHRSILARHLQKQVPGLASCKTLVGTQWRVCAIDDFTLCSGVQSMTSLLSPDCDLLTLPFSASTDFLDLAECCDRFAETLIECGRDEDDYKLALLGRLGSCLALLAPTLNDPIPAHLIERLTVDKLPEPQSWFEPDHDALCAYCQALTQLLSQHTLPPEMEVTLRGLLCELVWMFAADMKAPRWER